MGELDIYKTNLFRSETDQLRNVLLACLDTFYYADEKDIDKINSFQLIYLQIRQDWMTSEKYKKFIENAYNYVLPTGYFDLLLPYFKQWCQTTLYEECKKMPITTLKITSIFVFLMFHHFEYELAEIDYYKVLCDLKMVAPNNCCWLVATFLSKTAHGYGQFIDNYDKYLKEIKDSKLVYYYGKDDMHKLLHISLGNRYIDTIREFWPINNTCESLYNTSVLFVGTEHVTKIYVRKIALEIPTSRIDAIYIDIVTKWHNYFDLFVRNIKIMNEYIDEHKTDPALKGISKYPLERIYKLKDVNTLNKIMIAKINNLEIENIIINEETFTNAIIDDNNYVINKCLDNKMLITEALVDAKIISLCKNCIEGKTVKSTFFTDYINYICLNDKQREIISKFPGIALRKTINARLDEFQKALSNSKTTKTEFKKLVVGYTEKLDGKYLRHILATYKKEDLMLIFLSQMNYSVDNRTLEMLSLPHITDAVKSKIVLKYYEGMKS
uniref:Uncharacterized protein n=1 Tax=viral metagenome TaxID=1070528 RepID=A0A6C0EAL7_9ZZZZ